MKMIGFYDYTVILTYLSLMSGTIGIMLCLNGMGHPYLGMFFLLFSGLCDTFDGKVARTKKDRTPQMKKFEILRYLKRFSLLIFLVSLAGAAAIYLYADGRQKYTASVIIRYTNDGISDGYTPDGSELDVNEIYSSTVISQAMDALGASGRLSTIRSNISVTQIGRAHV